jgi:hypothetical protein
MFRLVTVCSVIVLCVALSLAWSAPEHGEAARSPAPAKPLSPAADPGVLQNAAKMDDQFTHVIQKLNGPVSLEHGMDANTPLRDALEFLGDQRNILILLNTAAFKKQGIEDIDMAPVKMPKLTGVRLGAVLRLLLSQVNAAYLVRADYIEVTTLQDSRPEALPGNQSAHPRALLPLVSAAIERRPLAEALKELSSESDISIIVDSRAGEKETTTAVTATFKNAPLDTAVRILADSAGLGSILIDNVLYVSTKANIKMLEREQTARGGE